MSGYYDHIRSDAPALLPRGFSPRRILDVGCGEGNTAAFLKDKFAAQVVGIETHAASAAIARSKLDRVIETSVESPTLDLPQDHFDLILCLDVLEHLLDPWATLARLKDSLRDDGLLLISLPNVQNWHVLLGLLFGRWDYTDAGLMDRTHLRFFTERSARRMICGAGFRVVDFRRSMGPEVRLLNALTLGLFRSFLTFHLYFLVRKENS